MDSPRVAKESISPRRRLVNLTLNISFFLLLFFPSFNFSPHLQVLFVKRNNKQLFVKRNNKQKGEEMIREA